MEVTSTLVVLGEAEVKASAGVTQGQTLKAMIGSGQYPTDRLRVALANYEPNTATRSVSSRTTEPGRYQVAPPPRS